MSAPAKPQAAPPVTRLPQSTARAVDATRREPVPTVAPALTVVEGHELSLTTTPMAVDRYYRTVCSCGAFRTRPCALPAKAWELGDTQHLKRIGNA